MQRVPKAILKLGLFTRPRAVMWLELLSYYDKRSGLTETLVISKSLTKFCKRPCHVIKTCIQYTISSRARFAEQARASKGCIQDTLSSRATLGLPANFRPSASREQRYLAYKSKGTKVLEKFKHNYQVTFVTYHKTKLYEYIYTDTKSKRLWVSNP